MAQKYNPSTGQWEDDEEDSSSFNSGTAAFGSGAPALQQFQSQQAAPTDGWKDSYFGFTPDRENRVATVNNGNLFGAVREASYLPNSADKYTSRFTDYFNTAQSKLGENFSSVQMISDTDNTNWQNITAGPVYLGTTGSGKKYVLEVPHSPGGAFNDWKTSPSDGWVDLGLGDLGGEGNEQIGYNAGGSMIPFEQFRGFGPGAATVMDNVNPRGSSFGDFLKTALPIALLAAGGTGLAGMFSGAAGVGAAELGAMAGLGGEAALGSGIGLGGGLGFSGAGGLGLTGEIAGLGSLGFGGATAAGLAGTGFGAGWAGLGDAVGAGLSGVSDFNDFTSMFDTVKQGQGALGELSNSIGNMGMDSILPQSSLELPGSSMPGSSAIDIPMGPPEASSMEGLYLDDFGGGTNAMGEFTNGRGVLSPQDRIATSLRQLGMDRVPAADLTQGANKMYNFMTDPMGGKRPGMFQAPSPLSLANKGLSAVFDYKANKDAMGMYEDQLNKVRNYQDSNRSRGDFANQQWQQTVQDPSARYREWMNGAGGIMRDQLVAQAAKSGKRGSYLNSGALMRDMYKNSLADQDNYLRSIQGGFSTSPNNEAEAMKYMAPMASMERNKYAPFGQALGAIGRGFELADMAPSLSKLFGR